MWPTALYIKGFVLIMVLLYAITANSATAQPTTGSNVVEALSSSPNDVTQLLSSLEKENNSLISQTEFTPLFKKIEHHINQLNQRSGIKIGMDYIPLYEHAAETVGRQNAGGGEFYLFGKWNIFKEQTNSPLLGFKVEERHSYTTVYPGLLAEQFNSTIKTVSGYEHLNPAITELWFQSFLIKDKMAFRAGKVDLTSIMNSFAFDSRRFYFLSDVFSSTPALDKPSKSLGVVASLKMAKHVYVTAGIADLNGTDDSASFDTLSRGEYIKAIEIGYRGKIVNPQSDNYHIFLWQSDARKELNIPDDHGFSVVLQKNVANRFIPFFKANINSGRVKEMKQLYTSGFGYHYPFNGRFGLLGFAAGYAILSEKQTGHQIILESFYRIQLTPFSQLTPDIQMIYTPMLSQWVPVMNLRFRIAV